MQTAEIINTSSGPQRECRRPFAGQPLPCATPQAIRNPHRQLLPGGKLPHSPKTLLRQLHRRAPPQDPAPGGGLPQDKPL